MATTGRYRTDQLIMLQKQTAHGGRMFVSFNFQFVNINRLQKDFYQEIDSWINQLAQTNILLIKNFTKDLPNTNDWGDCF